MNLRRYKPEDPELNITSLVDVVLMLLVFFMLSTTFVQNGGLHIQLPTANSVMSMAQSRSVEVAVDAKGRYFVNGNELLNSQPETLRQALAAISGNHKDIPLYVRADASATNQAVVTVMDVAGQLGFVQIRILTSDAAHSK